MKKALILTASFGGGHNKAANNIREKLELRGFDVEEIDLLKEISEKLFLSEGTVRNYISGILEKLELRDRTQLAIYYYTK